MTQPLTGCGIEDKEFFFFKTKQMALITCLYSVPSLPLSPIHTLEPFPQGKSWMESQYLKHKMCFSVEGGMPMGREGYKWLTTCLAYTRVCAYTCTHTQSIFWGDLDEPLGHIWNPWRKSPLSSSHFKVYDSMGTTPLRYGWLFQPLFSLRFNQEKESTIVSTVQSTDIIIFVFDSHF